MGVHGLWTLLEPVGKPVPLESLENKVLAVDVSLWLHQANKGFRDGQGNCLPNAHLLGLCHRICKLLFYRVKPVFVFDGGVPSFKKKIIESRYGRKRKAVENSEKVAEKILKNYISSEVINGELGIRGKGTKLPKLKKNQERDLFELSPLPSRLSSDDPDTDSSEESDDFETVSSIVAGNNIHSADFSSESFRSLPPETQHEILLQLKDTKKQSSWNSMHEMPEEANDFSGFQIQRLLKRRHLQVRLDEVAKEMSSSHHEHLYLEEGDVVHSRKIASQESTSYVLIKKSTTLSTPLPTPGSSPIKKDDKNVLDRLSERNEIDGHPIDLEEEYSQQELFAMFSNIKQQPPAGHQSGSMVLQPSIESTSRVLRCSSTEDFQEIISLQTSSESESDFEEVCDPVAQSPILSVSIDSNRLNQPYEDDIFADIFAVPSVNQKTVLTSQEFRETSVDCSISEKNEDPNHESNHEKFVSEEIGTSDAQPPKAALSLKTSHCSSSENEDPEDGAAASADSRSEAQSDSSTNLVDLYLSSSVANRSPLTERSTLDLRVDNTSEEFREEAESAHRLVNDGHDTIIESDINDAPELYSTDSENEEASTSVQNGVVICSVEAPSCSSNSQSREQLEQYARRLEEEQIGLIREHGKQQRLATSITDQMSLEAQELLRLFGIPYLVAPMEAEAQCAFLDQIGLTQGTITDDSDVWLFGGRRVYKNFFHQGKYVQYFQAEDINDVFKMNREKLISLALLTGSDYTEGIDNVGPVTAMEILSEFASRDGFETLIQFRDWLLRSQSKKNAPPENKIRRKIRNLEIRPDFPDRTIVNAYLNPEVNESRGKFSWVAPDTTALQDYLNAKIGWNLKTFQQVVLPVLGRFNSKESQTRIDSYFGVKFRSPTAFQMSKRVMSAICKADFGTSDLDFPSSDNSVSASQQVVDRAKKNKRKVTTVGGKSKFGTKSSKSQLSTGQKTSDMTSESTGEIIWQKEKDRQILQANKSKAIEILRKKGNAGVKKSTNTREQRTVKKRSNLSETDTE